MRSEMQYARRVLCAAVVLGTWSPVVQAAEQKRPESAEQLHRTGRDLIRAGNFSEAVRYLESATKRRPSDPELHRLLAAAAFDRALELENRIELTLSKTSLVGMMSSIVSRSPDACPPGGKEVLDIAIGEAVRSYHDSLPLKAEAARLLQEATSEAETALEKNEQDSQAILLVVWIDAYRVVEAEHVQTIRLHLERSRVLGGPTPLDEPAVKETTAESIDPRKARESAFHLLSKFARADPESPLPYLAAAEWMQLTGVTDGADHGAMQKIRSQRYQAALPEPERSANDAAARSEYEAARRLTADNLEAVTGAHMIALYERAMALDPKDAYGTSYGLYIQVLPADPNRGTELLEHLREKGEGDALVPLESARRAVAEQIDYALMVRHLNEARLAPRFRRPLFVSIPVEIREPLLGAHAVWPRLRELGSGFEALYRGLDKLVSSTKNPAEVQRLLLLKAELGAVLMRGDLPQDWALGIRIRRDALGRLLRSPDELPQDLAAKLGLELERVRALAGSRPLPVIQAFLWQGQVHFVPSTDWDVHVSGPFILVTPGGASVISR